MSALERLYHSSPVFLQNLMTSLYGIRLRKLRYGGNFDRYLNDLLESETLTAARARSLGNQRLQRLVRHAGTHVPFYRHLFETRNIDPDSIDIDNYSRILPVTEKTTVKENPAQFRSEFFPESQLSTIFTSGSTGTPLEVTATKESLQENYAFFSRFLRGAGVSDFDCSITFAGRLIVPLEQSTAPFWRFNRAMNTWLFSSYHLAEANFPAYIAAIEEVQPVFIDSYPSAIYVLARYINEHGIALKCKVRAIVTSSETLFDHQREEIQKAFGAPVFDQYGCAEMAVFVGQCSQGSYHVHSEYGLLEIVDGGGEPVAPGQVGEIVCTGFINLAMPLIRYRIGDSGILSGQACACGRSSPVLQQIVGRTDDLIKTPDGKLVGRLDPLFKGLSNIDAAQIIQEDLSSIRILLVPDDDYTDSNGSQMIDKLRQRVGKEMDVSIELVESIPVGSNGKFKSVISHVN